MMIKNNIREIILEFQEDGLPEIIHRFLSIPELPKNVRKALVFIGMRRAGKTYLMYQNMKDLLHSGLDKNKLLYINFEDDRLINFTASDFQLILDVYFEMFPKFAGNPKVMFYFDEIQNIDGWEKFIRRLLDREKMQIFITGSSAKSLSKEIATNLRGRCLVTEVFPMSFIEFLKYKNFHDFKMISAKDKSLILNYFKTYLKRGGFPETLEMVDLVHKQTIQTYINAAVFRDVIERHNLSNPHIVKLFLTNCLQNIASPLSVTKIYNSLKSSGEIVGRNSLYEYLSYFEDAYLLFTVAIFDYSTRKRTTSPKKIYCADPSIINSYSIKTDKEISTCLENVVYMHLRQRHYEEIFYYKTNTNQEVDFIAQDINGEIHLIQVCIDLSDEQTRKRELNALVTAANELQKNIAYIITIDFEETVILTDLTIHIIPFWKWVIA